MPSKGEVIIIDGYNALFDLANLEHQRESVNYQFDKEREWFISVLQKRLGQSGIVVFDGRGDIQTEKKGNLWIIFTGEEETADDIIVRLLSQETVGRVRFKISKTKIIVVTNDKELRKRVRAARPGVEIREVGFLN